jgi:hypothetical protein
MLKIGKAIIPANKNTTDDINATSKKIFSILGDICIKEGDSANCLGGTYYSVSIFGLRIKLEYNSYKHENEYFLPGTVS